SCLALQPCDDRLVLLVRKYAACVGEVRRARGTVHFEARKRAAAGGQQGAGGERSPRQAACAGRVKIAERGCNLSPAFVISAAREISRRFSCRRGAARIR